MSSVIPVLFAESFLEGGGGPSAQRFGTALCNAAVVGVGGRSLGSGSTRPRGRWAEARTCSGLARCTQCGASRERLLRKYRRARE